MTGIFKFGMAVAVVSSALALGFFSGQSPDVGAQAEQTAPVQSAQAPAPTPPPAAPAPAAQVVDETALRYFARQGDTRRLQAEIARLQALYPDWTPPADPLANDFASDPAVDRMWEFFGNGDFAGTRAAIAEKQASDPTFQPAAELLRSLDLGEAAARLTNASDAKQYDTVISIAANMPDLLTCNNVDVMWRLAEAFIKRDNIARSTDVYVYLLTNCTVAEERFATLQKAMGLLDRPNLAPLIALERKNADGTGEFASLRLDMARNGVAQVLTGKASKADPSDMELLQAEAKATNSADDLRLLGWYALNQKRPQEGREWFELALAQDPSALSAHGLAVSLLDLRMPAEAEAAIAEYRDESEELTSLYLTAAASLLAKEPRPVLDGDLLARVVEETTSNRSALTARELGWYAYAFNQPQTAADWFGIAQSWDPVDEEAAYGLLIASDLLGDTATVSQIKTLWAARSVRIATFGDVVAPGARVAQSRVIAQPAPVAAPVAQVARVVAAPAEVAVRQPEPVRRAEAQPVADTAAAPTARRSGNSGGNRGSGSCTTFLPPQSLSPEQALNRGWCLMNLERTTEALASFAQALYSPSAETRRDAAYGQSLAYLRLGLTKDAVVSAAASEQPGQRTIQLEAAILAQKATTAYDLGNYADALIAMDERARYAAEQNDLLTLRAWSYYHLRRFGESERIFKAVAATGYAPAIEGLAASRSAQRAQERTYE